MKRETVIPVISEEVEAGTRKVKTGAVRVHKTIHERAQLIEQPLFNGDVEIERVVKNQSVEGPLPMREEGDTMIIPVVKQVLRVEWVLTEEVRLTRRRRMEQVKRPVTVLEEQAEIERVDASGQAKKTSDERPENRGLLGVHRPSFVGKLEK
jgi:stress response protein YsnF